jgi:hypothetical protein
MGINTKIGNGDIYDYRIVLSIPIGITVSDEVKEKIKLVVEYLRAVTIRYYFGWEYPPGSLERNPWWIINKAGSGVLKSKMGISTKLSKEE